MITRESLFYFAIAVIAGFAISLIDLSQMLAAPVFYYIGLNLFVLIVGVLALERTGSLFLSISVIFTIEGIWNLFWMMGDLASGRHMHSTIDLGAGYVVPILQYYAGIIVQLLVGVLAFILCAREAGRSGTGDESGASGPGFFQEYIAGNTAADAVHDNVFEGVGRQ